MKKNAQNSFIKNNFFKKDFKYDNAKSNFESYDLSIANVCDSEREMLNLKERN